MSVNKNNIIFSLIASANMLNGIGKNGSIPWSLSGDIRLFKNLTEKTLNPNKLNAVIMGRKTWESIPAKFRPLKNRLNIILTKNRDYDLLDVRDVINVRKCDSVDDAISYVNSTEIVDNIENVFFIGGNSVYQEAINLPCCKYIYLTRVKNNDECDSFFPEIDEKEYFVKNFSNTMIENETEYKFYTYQKRENCNYEELQYINIADDIIRNGVERIDRTGVGSLSIFGTRMSFSLKNNSFPLLTTKKVFFRGVVEELLWFISGSTNANILKDKGINIWNKNGSREFLDRNGFTERAEGDLGPVYGFQWRHFGAEYTDMNGNYEGMGIDQLAQVINKINNTPHDRRIILSAWNPSDISLMVLPPCHMMCQFYVSNGELSCQMYQRSGDVGLGVPFNIASYSLLTIMIAQVCGLKPKEFIYIIGDAHIYLNHIDSLKEQFERKPRNFPTLHINPNIDNIDNFNFSDFTLENYKPYPNIKMDMAL